MRLNRRQWGVIETVWPAGVVLIGWPLGWSLVVDAIVIVVLVVPVRIITRHSR